MISRNNFNVHRHNLQPKYFNVFTVLFCALLPLQVFAISVADYNAIHKNAPIYDAGCVDASDATTDSTPTSSPEYIAAGNVPKEGLEVGATYYGGQYRNDKWQPSNDVQGGITPHDDNGVTSYDGKPLAGHTAFAELGMGEYLGHLPFKKDGKPNTKLEITYKGKSIIAEKMDIGAGQAGNSHYKIDLWWETAKLLGVKGDNPDVKIHVVPDSTPVTPLNGTPSKESGGGGSAPATACCPGGGGQAVSGTISPEIGKGLPKSTAETLQKVFVAAGKKFNVDPNFLASFYYVENFQGGDTGGDGHGAPYKGDGKWRDPAPPYGHGGPWPTSSASANGPFQFIPGTWASEGQDGNGDGDKDVQDLWDAAFGAAHYIAGNGGKTTDSRDDWRRAALTYNHADWYADDILSVWRYLSGGGQADVSGGVSGGSSCASGSSGSVDGYKNPYRDIQNLQKMRIDQGIDMGGHGPIYAIGKAKINIATTSAGWPGGNFINYTLLDGAAKGKHVYMSEHCDIKVSVGDTVDSDTVICDLKEGYPWSEAGWAADPSQGNLAAAHAVYNEGDVTAYGLNFSKFMKKIGGPEGVKDRPNVVGSLPAGWPQW